MSGRKRKTKSGSGSAARSHKQAEKKQRNSDSKEEKVDAPKNAAPLGQKVVERPKEPTPPGVFSPQYKVGDSSLVWKIFQKIPSDPGHHWCPLCCIRVATGNVSMFSVQFRICIILVQGTSNCLRHFRTDHTELYLSAQAEKAAHDAKKAAKQPTLSAPMGEKATKKIVRKLAEMCCLDAEAFAVVLRAVRRSVGVSLSHNLLIQGFTAYSRALNSSFKIPHPDVVKTETRELGAEVQERVSCFQFMSASLLMVNCSPSRSSRRWLSVAVHRTAGPPSLGTATVFR